MNPTKVIARATAISLDMVLSCPRRQSRTGEGQGDRAWRTRSALNIHRAREIFHGHYRKSANQRQPFKSGARGAGAPRRRRACRARRRSTSVENLRPPDRRPSPARSEEHTSELQSPDHLVCRLLLEKKKTFK